jgi:hypothetical protein
VLIACRAGLTEDHAARVVSADNIAVWKGDKIAVWKGNDMGAKLNLGWWPKTAWVAAALASVFAAHGWAQETDKPTVVPVTNAAFHQFTFQDENMSLENVTLPPGFSTGYHSHDKRLNGTQSGPW